MRCPEGGEHEVVSAAVEDRDRYDPSVLEKYNEYSGPRPNQLWGYCAKCREGMRWSVADQQWRRWPGGLGQLPHLNDEELDELGDAVAMRMHMLGEFIGQAQNTDTRSEIHYKLRILQSLSTAIQEARYHLYPPEGTYAPRFWGEAWTTLSLWIEEQLAGIERSSQTQAGFGAVVGFVAVKRKIDELKRGGKAAGVEETQDAPGQSSRSQPGPADLS